MAATTRRWDPLRAWAGAALLAILALVGGAVLFTELVYDRFIWHYFWGPIYADAHNAACAVRSGGTVTLPSSREACAAAVERGAVVAEPGYTLVSEVGYALVLLFMIVGVLFLLRRLGVGQDRELFYSLVPFMFFGGALRVVEDANDAAGAADPFIGYPLNTFIISPLIYFTVAAVTIGSGVVCVRLAREGVFEDYLRPLLAVGTVACLLTVGYLVVLAFTTAYVGFYPQVFVVVVVLATAVTLAVWAGVREFLPGILAGTRGIGLVVLWGHSIDGVANVVAADWVGALGLPFRYGAKHPVNRLVIDVTESVLPTDVATAIGTSWPFLLLKVVAVLGVIWVFDESIFEESPRYAILLLVAILAVGLGPGTRDMLRATFGI